MPSLRRLIHLASITAFLCAAIARAQNVHPVVFRVRLDPASSTTLSGRLLLFAKRGRGSKRLDVQEFQLEDTWVAGTEVHDLVPGKTVEIDANQEAFPRSFDQMAPGEWEIQAVLDPTHTYNYSGREPQDWESPVTPYTAGGPEAPALTLDHHPQLDPRRQKAVADARLKLQPGEIEEQLIQSSLLTRFWGRPRHVQAWVVLPPG
jgi:hypothetical protein